MKEPTSVVASPDNGVPLVPIPWRERGMTQKEAKRYLPPGATISKCVDKRRGRPFWEVKSDALLRSVSRRYTTEASGMVSGDNEALQFCFRHVWLAVTAKHGTPCPWAIDDSVQGVH